MITFDFTQIYPSLTAMLLLLSGGLLLTSDVKMYHEAGMTKEQSWSRVLGIINISLGILLIIARYIYFQWFW